MSKLGEMMDSLKPATDMLRADNARLRRALEKIASWDMYSGSAKYQMGEADPRGYYAHAFELAEHEIAQAKLTAKCAIEA